MPRWSSSRSRTRSLPHHTSPRQSTQAVRTYFAYSLSINGNALTTLVALDDVDIWGAPVPLVQGRSVVVLKSCEKRAHRNLHGYHSDFPWTCCRQRNGAVVLVHPGRQARVAAALLCIRAFCSRPHSVSVRSYFPSYDFIVRQLMVQNWSHTRTDILRYFAPIGMHSHKGYSCSRATSISA